MSESTLSVDYSEIRAAMGRVAGVSRDPTEWDAKVTEAAAAALKTGMREAYWPEGGYQWSFLTPAASMSTWRSIAGTLSTAVYSSATGLTTLTATTSVFNSTVPGHSYVDSGTYTVDGYTSGTIVTLQGDASGETGAFTIAGDDTYRAPDNYGHLIGRMVYAAGQGRDGAFIEMVSLDTIDQLRSVSTTGAPSVVAVVPTTNLAGQTRWDWVFYPEPDRAYTLKFRYRVVPNLLTSSAPYPFGPTWFGQVILSACMAEMEKEIYGAYGAHRDSFLRSMSQGMENDRLTQPRTLGPMLSPEPFDVIPVQFQDGITLTY